MRPPLVLLPGTSCDGRVFGPMIERLGVDCTIIDVGGHDSIAALGDHVFREAPTRFCLAGFSLGGMIALDMIARAPERIAALGLICTKAGPTPDWQKPQRLATLEAARRAGMARSAVIGLPRMVHSRALNDSALTDLIIDMAVSEGVDVLARQSYASNARLDRRPDLPRIAVPTLVVYADSDVLCTPEEGREMADGIPGAHLVAIPDSGHMALLEKPDPVAAAIRDWLDTIP